MWLLNAGEVETPIEGNLRICPYCRSQRFASAVRSVMQARFATGNVGVMCAYEWEASILWTPSFHNCLLTQTNEGTCAHTHIHAHTHTHSPQHYCEDKIKMTQLSPLNYLFCALNVIAEFHSSDQTACIV